MRVSCDTWLVVFGGLSAVLLRAITGLHGYSGEAKPPMYGDYEAQRHWMEITTNLPVTEWYKNSSDNHLEYWGLDYPPLTAYHMYLCGIIAGFINENYTKLHDSRGYESEEHKLFMRMSVLITDVLLYIPAVITFFYITAQIDGAETRTRNHKSKKKGHRPLSPSLASILALFYPGIILIDHGHFQYNSISLGFMIIAVTLLLRKREIFASMAFCMAISYKQMELYHALPFFFYLLSSCVPKPGQGAIYGLLKLSKLGLTVVVTLAFIYAPFLTDFETIVSVLDRQFPISRGVFEDKVSNVWCTLNIFYKLKSTFANHEMMRCCLFTTVCAVLPSSLDMFLRPNKKKFVLALINSSLAFFLFSFHVHEKSILLAAIPVMLYLPQEPFVCFWFLCLSVFSMVPLLIKVELIIATISLMMFFTTVFRISIEHFYGKMLNISDGLAEYYRHLLHVLLDIEYEKAKPSEVLTMTYRKVVENKQAVKSVAFHVIMVMSLVGCQLLAIAALTLAPPERYPDLYAVLISVYSAVHFMGFFLYFNVNQMQIPQEFEGYSPQANVKLKSS